MSLKRLISTAVLFAFVAIGVVNETVCGVLVTVVIVAGLYEFFRMLEQKGISIYKYFGIGMGALIPLSLMIRFEMTRGWEFFFIIAAVIFLILMQFKRRESTGVVVDISTTIFGILYVSWFLSFLIRIRHLPDGASLLVSIILITKAGDIGAYLIGSRFGKTPLIPRISPRKSVEGALGGVLFSVAAALACAPLLKFASWQSAGLGVMFSVLGQLGDLSESLMKRDCHVKDSSALIPGIGGVLDTVDSLLFTAPVFYFYISVLPK